MLAALFVNETVRRGQYLSTQYGTYLRAERARRGLTLDALADRADTSNPVISNLELGKRNPSREMVKRIAAALSGENPDPRTLGAIIDEGLVAAGFAPDGHSLVVVPVRDDNDLVYEDIVSDLDAASQAGELDDEARRRIRRQIQLEREEVRRRTGRIIVDPSDDDV